MGADEFADYTRQLFNEAVKDVDVVFDTVGGDTFARAFPTLKEGGFLVTSVAFPADEAQRFGVRAARVQCKPDAGQLAAIRDLVDADNAKAHVATVSRWRKSSRPSSFPKAGARAARSFCRS